MDITYFPRIRSCKGLHSRRVVFYHIFRIEDIFIHHHDHTFISCVFIRCSDNSVIQIKRPICTDSRGRAHSTDYHYWFRAMNRKIQEISRFLHRVCAMGDHYSIVTLLV